MGEEIKRWRCPYCDGLNEWQDAVCQICGDGRRPETAGTGGTAKTVGGVAGVFTPPADDTLVAPAELTGDTLGSSGAGKTVNTGSGAGTKTGYTGSGAGTKTDYAGSGADMKTGYTGSGFKTGAVKTPPPELEKKKKGGFGRLLIVAVIAVLAYFGGQQLGLLGAGGLQSPQTTNRPTAATAATESQSAGSGSAASVANWPAPQPRTVARFDAPSENYAFIETITDNGDGTAKLVVRQNNCPRSEYEVKYSLLKDKDHEVLPWVDDGWGSLPNQGYLFLNAEGKDGNYVRSCTGDSELYVPIVPGQYMQFFVIASDGGFTNVMRWRTPPVYFSADGYSKPQLPFSVREIRWCNHNPETYEIDKYYQITSASQLNALLGWNGSERTTLYNQIVFDTELDEQSFNNWLQAQPELECRIVVIGPDFAVASIAAWSFYPNYIDEHTMTVDMVSALDEYAVFTNRMSEGGFPSGYYSIKFFINGVNMGSTHLTL